MKKKNVILILLILGGSLLCIYGFTYAKYVYNSVWDYYLKSKGFYFTSDYLGVNLIKNANNLWDGESIYFNIRNNLNQSVVTDYDIEYKVECSIEGDASSYAECRLNGTDSNTQDGVLANFQTCVNNTGDGEDVSSLNKTECEMGGYDWVNQVAKKDFYFDVILTDDSYELSDVTVNVTATSTSPYRKALYGQFNLHRRDTKEDSVTMNYINYSNNGRLTISNSYASDKCIKVTWNANKLRIDANNNDFSSYNIDQNGYVNEIKFNIEAKENKSYIFYKLPLDAIYNIFEFNLEETTGC